MSWIGMIFEAGFIPIMVAGLMGAGSLLLQHHKLQRGELFFLIGLGLVILWRIPFAFTQRYMMPPVLLIIVLSGYGVMSVATAATIWYAALRKEKAAGRKACWAGIVLLLAIMLTCGVKGMREQESKPYFNDLPVALAIDMKSQNIPFGIVYSFMSSPNYVGFGDNVALVVPAGSDYSGIVADQNIIDFFKNEVSLTELRYAHAGIYIMTCEDKQEDMRDLWHKAFNEDLIPVYCYIRPKDKRKYILFRTERSSIYDALREQPREWEYSLFPAEKVKADVDVSQRLRSLGVSEAESAFLPSGWTPGFNTPGVWDAHGNSPKISCTSSGTWRFSAELPIMFTNNTHFPVDGTYVIWCEATIPAGGELSLLGLEYRERWSFVGSRKLCFITGVDGKVRLSALMPPQKGSDYWQLAMICRGNNITIEKLAISRITANIKDDGSMTKSGKNGGE
ncbi:MAG: hypothetical protein AB7F40_02110 [Victivallaceae bacterium]|nr:hypothetical protein [Victivallaceae bacterium]